MQTQLEYVVTAYTIILIKNHSSHLTFNILAWFCKALWGQKWPHADEGLNKQLLNFVNAGIWHKPGQR